MKELNYPNYEIVVVGNGSADRTIEYVERYFPNAKIIRIEKNRGYSGGFNFGLDFAFNKNNADYALISNNDVKADKNVISKLAKVAETDDKIGFVTGKAYYYERPNVLQTVGKKEDPIRWNGGHIGNKEEDKGQYNEVCEKYWADDIFTFVSRKLYIDTGGYNPLFFLHAEEYDWQARAKKLGYKIMYTPHAKLWHKDSMTTGKESALNYYYDVRNPMLVILLHKSPQFFRKYFWLHFRKHILRTSLGFLKHGKISLAFSKWRGLFSGIWWGMKNKKFTLGHFIG